MEQLDKIKFGKFISQLRKEKQLTQKDLAEKLFISDKAVSKWETGKSMPDISLLIPISKIFDISVTELLLCERNINKDNLECEKVESILKNVIKYKEQDTNLREYKRKNIWKYVFLIMALISSIIVLYTNSKYNETIFAFQIMNIMIGLYSFFFAHQKLPEYYDNNDIHCVNDGIFRMNLIFVTFNNRNWRYILCSMKIWSIIWTLITPFLVYLFLYFENYILLINPIFICFYLFSLFVPLIIVGKKYK